MTFCYHQALKGYFYECLKHIYISWMIIGNYTSCTMSEFYEIANVSINVSASHCPLNVASGMAWTTKGIDSLNPTTNNSFV